ncbi:MAG: fatty acid desaturase [Paracoccaceae bacterium]
MDDPLDHRSLIAGLTPETRRALCSQSDGPGLLRIGLHLGMILLLSAAIFMSAPGWPVLMLIQGILLVFLFTALHETTHRTAFAQRWLNDAVAHVSAFLVILGPAHFRYFHMAHHRFTHDPKNDPELASPKPETLWDFAVYLTGLPEWIWRATTLVRNALGWNADGFVPQRGLKRIRREAIAFLLGYALLLITFGADLFWIWLLPLVLGGPFLRVYLLAEHTFCPHVSNMLQNTRTTFTHWVVRWLAWNMPYHTEHHAYPAVPFHRLPAFHELARAHLRETQTGYAGFAANYMTRIRSAGPLGEVSNAP